MQGLGQVGLGVQQCSRVLAVQSEVNRYLEIFSLLFNVEPTARNGPGKTVCPKSLEPIHIVTLYRIGQDFLDRQSFEERI